MVDIISTPTGQENTFGQNDTGFAYYETTNSAWRGRQEDALVCLSDLEKESNLQNLTPQQFGERLWSTHMQLDAQSKEQNKGGGTTASSNFYDGKGNIITATLADASAFAVFYGKDRSVLKVVRLNSITHKPTDASESKRIKDLGGFVFMGRVSGSLAVSRAIGDHDYVGNDKAPLVCAESQIDIISIDELTMDVKGEIESIEIISTCDGFTDGATDQSKEGHEAYLKSCLEQSDIKGKQGQALCEALVNRAKMDGSKDNISVATQTIYAHGKISDKPAFMGIYDGHGGADTSIFVAENIGQVFRAQCALSESDYAKNEFSVNKHKDAYERDHKPSAHKTASPVTGSSHTDSTTYESTPVVSKSNDEKVKDFLTETFIPLLQNFKDLYITLPDDSEEKAALLSFITNVEKEKTNWDLHLQNTKAFIDNCRVHVATAQKSELKNHADVNVLFKLFIKAINWLASFIFEEPLIKTKTYSDLSLFKTAVESVEKDAQENKPQKGNNL
jgi:integrin-linked kinase-associated serine/threonine phosphatase 2C